MRVLFLICFMLLISSGNPNDDEFDPYLFRNNCNDEIFDSATGIYLYSIFSIGDRFGDSTDVPFRYLDTNLYKNKTLGFILNDLSQKYKYHDGMALNGVLGLDYNDFSHRTHFAFSFKYNDTLSLCIVGMLNKSDRFYEESDSVAFTRILESDKYVLLPVIYNKKVQYRKIIELMKENKSPRLKNTLEELLRDYPEVAK